DARIAVTETLVRGCGATACQTSVVPGWPLARTRSDQVRPPPVTAENVCPAALFGPSEVRKAISTSLAWWVVNAGDVTDGAAELWCVVTWTSTASVAALAVPPPARAEATTVSTITTRAPTRKNPDLELRKMRAIAGLPPGRH